MKKKRDVTERETSGRAREGKIRRRETEKEKDNRVYRVEEKKEYNREHRIATTLRGNE